MVVIGGGRFIWPIVQQVQFLSLEARAININSKRIRTDPLRRSPRVDIEAVAVVRIPSSEPQIGPAIQNLIGKTGKEIEEMARGILEGRLRGVCVHMTAAEILADRDRLEQSVVGLAEKDLASIGLETLSFVVKEVEEGEAAGDGRSSVRKGTPESLSA